MTRYIQTGYVNDNTKECYLVNADPIESSCGINGCTSFSFKCVCFDK